MEEPSPRGSRLAIAGGLVAALVVGGAGFLLGRETAPATPPVVRVMPMETPTPAATEPPLPAVLGRREILKLARVAADAAASQQPLPQDMAAAANRRFSLSLPFGCEGPEDAESGGRLRWQYDEKAGVLRLQVTPEVWRTGEWWPDGEAPKLEAVEGFWVSRPWSSGDTCAARLAAPATEEAVAEASESAGETEAAAEVDLAAEAAKPEETLAIAQFFPAGTSRQALRGGDPFQSVVKIPPDQFQGQSGFRVRLTGRIEQVPGNGPVRCIQRDGANQRPTCVVAASIEEVAIEHPASGQVLATWTLRRR